MKLKIPPVIIFLCFGLLMFLAARFLPVGYFDFFGRTYLMGFLVLLAIVVSFAALIQFFKSRTSIDPIRLDTMSTLVTTGIYTYSRNPMYLGMLLLLLAWGISLGNAFNVLLAAGYVSYMNRFQIEPEEKALLHTFGKEYRYYCTRVRRWF